MYNGVHSPTVHITQHLTSTYHVWALGRLSGLPNFLMQNFCGPLLPVYNTKMKDCVCVCVCVCMCVCVVCMCVCIPCSSANPFIGTREVPVTNCSRRACNSLSNDSTACSHNLYCVMLVWLGAKHIKTTYLPKPLNDIICFFVSLFVDGILSPVIDIDLTQTTH